MSPPKIKPCIYLHSHSGLTQNSVITNKSRSSAVAERLHDASWHWIFC